MPPVAILNIAVNCPLRQTFDYLAPADIDPTAIEAGVRVRVPFGNRTMTGVVMAVKADTEITTAKLKTASAVLDATAVIDQTLLKLGLWMSDYYQHPVGECIAVLLPPLLRKGEPTPNLESTFWRLTAMGKNFLPKRNATKQQRVMDTLLNVEELADANKTQ